MSYGATPEEWAFAIRQFGADNLLPVVCNPRAVISPRSSIRALGKTPSFYNANGEVIGIKNWTAKIPTATEQAEWQKNPDYGVCVQTRSGNGAFDIDVNDTATAMRYAHAIMLGFGEDQFIFRCRENSGRITLPIRVTDGFRWRSMKVEGGMIDFLGLDKQFVGFGTHPSGARLQWRKADRLANNTVTPSPSDASDLI